jgi:hypothetical protein
VPVKLRKEQKRPVLNLSIVEEENELVDFSADEIKVPDKLEHKKIKMSLTRETIKMKA